MSRLSASATFSWPTRTLPESASAICSVTSGTELPTIAAAVAYAANALPKSSTNPPRRDGSSTGRPTWRQYCHAEAPQSRAASLHWTRSPSSAGATVSTISGTRKYR